MDFVRIVYNISFVFKFWLKEAAKVATPPGSNLSMVVEHGNSDENFWQFSDAFSDVRPEPKLVSYFHLVVLVIFFFLLLFYLFLFFGFW